MKEHGKKYKAAAEKRNVDTRYQPRQAIELRPDKTEAGQHWISLRQRQCKWPVLAASEHVSRRQLVDVATPDTREVNLFVEGPTPDWALPVPNLLEHSPPGVKRFAFELDGLPPGVSPEGAALKLTLVGGDRAYEFNINLN